MSDETWPDEDLRQFISAARRHTMGVKDDRLLRDYLAAALGWLDRLATAYPARLGADAEPTAEIAEDTPEVKRDKDAALIDRLQRENLAQPMEIARLKDLLGRCDDDRYTAERALLLIERNHIGSDIIELYDICLVAGGARAREAITRLTNNIAADEVPF